MDVLVDTNILIHRESDRIVPPELRELARAINEQGHRILTHLASVGEMRQDPVEERRERAESRVEKYPELAYPPSPSPSDTAFRDAVPEGPAGSNDRIDNMLLFAVYDEGIDFLDIMEVYEKLYDETKEIRNELREVRTTARRWRKRSWLWRGISFVIGFLVGTGLIQLVLSYV